jgi:molecular chaperone GrpE
MTAKQTAKKKQQQQDPRAKESETPESEASETEALDAEPAEELEEGTAPYEAEAEMPEADEAARVAELEAEAGKLKDQLLRALAELENTRRRAERDRQEAAKYAAVPLARDLLGVADNLRRALENAPESAQGQEDALKQFLSGVEMTEKELQDAFAKHGIERLDPKGEKFDPHWHEAMFEVPTNDAEPGTVVQVVQSGYRLDERLLRPARVGVARKA